MEFKFKKIYFLIIVFGFLFVGFNSVQASTVDELNKEIQKKSDYIKNLERLNPLFTLFMVEMKPNKQ